jgi:hypothetical protein
MSATKIGSVLRAATASLRIKRTRSSAVVLALTWWTPANRFCVTVDQSRRLRVLLLSFGLGFLDVSADDSDNQSHDQDDYRPDAIRKAGFTDEEHQKCHANGLPASRAAKRP